ncbi:MAG: hypothetical protein NW226_22265 [Microscillaceae bacterium]|nr:hypothetical protein [Microscillaceae bacterium]
MRGSTSNSIAQRSEEIYNLLAAGDIEQAIKRLMDFITDFNPSNTYLQKIIALNRDYQQFTADKDPQAEGFKDQRNYLIHQIFDLIDQIENDLISSI